VTLHEPPVAGARLQLAALTTFGLEALAAAELRELGFADPTVENGRVRFAGGLAELARACLWLRTADRVVLRLAEFPAADFESLYQGVQAVRWEDFLPEDAGMVVNARSHRSRLTALPTCQATVKKGIVQALRRRFPRERFPETGPRYAIELALDRDQAVLSLDATGQGLHRRGYRRRAGQAPLRENLAAALVLLSRWQPSRPLADPLCGSGTIPIEAALLGLGRAPGAARSFAAEAWPHVPPSVWREARAQARQREAEAAPAALSLWASDRDEGMVRVARENARAAGVLEAIRFRAQPAEEFRSDERFGCLICNPPYGERSGTAAEAEELYRRLGRTFARLADWSVFVLTGHPGFERFYGRRADRNRKLYNGNLKTYLYQYFGPLPPGQPPGQPEAPGMEAAGSGAPA
jgi:putative N6-adenine-specific DNA methylase